MGEYADAQIERDQRRLGVFGHAKRRTQPAATVQKVICPYCKKPAKLVDSAIVYGGKSYGLIWDCRPCDAYVGIHKNDGRNAPLGRLANKELRAYKRHAHSVFDPLWQSGRMSRHEAYRTLQKLMGMSPKEAHIGEFDVADCKKLIQLMEETE